MIFSLWLLEPLVEVHSLLLPYLLFCVMQCHMNIVVVFLQVWISFIIAEK